MAMLASMAKPAAIDKQDLLEIEEEASVCDMKGPLYAPKMVDKIKLKTSTQAHQQKTYQVKFLGISCWILGLPAPSVLAHVIQ
jgi:hypothetical protein